PRGAGRARLRAGRRHLRAGGRRGAGAEGRDDLLCRELHGRPLVPTAHRGRRQLEVDGGRLRHVFERDEAERPRGSARSPPAAWSRQRAGGARDGRRRPAEIRRDLGRVDHRHRRSGWWHAGEARRDGVAGPRRRRRHGREACEISRRPRPGARAVGVRRPADASRGARSLEGALNAGWREVAARYRVDLVLFLASLAIYALASDGLLAHQSLAPHFVYQADAFLHGQLSLTVAQPPNLNDWVLWNGRWYVSFPPFPAVLMMPFVAVWGLSFNDVAFTLFFAAANVALLYRALRRLQPQRAEWEHVAFAL